MESGPPTDAGPLGFFASNVPPSAIPAVPADAGDAGTIISTSCSSGNSGCPFGAPTAIMQNDGSPADLYVVDGLLVDTTQQITFQGPIPVIIVSLGPVYVDGTISVASDFFSPGSGGFPPATPGPGAGQNGVGAYSNSAGGGGGYRGPGGAGINGDGGCPRRRPTATPRSRPFWAARPAAPSAEAAP